MFDLIKETNIPYFGTNYKKFNEEAIYINSSAIVLEDIYTDINGNTIYGEWIHDTNQEYKEGNREPRIFCTKGKASITFNGTNILARVETNPGWAEADIYIDGKKPSEYNQAFEDKLYADSDYYSLLGAVRVEVELIRDLEDTEHLLEIYQNYTGTNSNDGFLPINMFKIYKSSITEIDTESWIMTSSNAIQYKHNILSLKLSNNSGATITDVSLNIGNYPLVDMDNKQIEDNNIGDITSDTLVETTFVPDITSISEVYSGVTDLSFNLRYDYPDPDGTITKDITTIIPVDDSDITYTESNKWAYDNDGTGGIPRKFSDTLDSTQEFDFTGSSLTITVQKDSGWGPFTITISNDNADDIVVSDTCDTNNPGSYDIVIDNLSEGINKYTLQVKDTKYVVIQGIKYDSTITYSNKLEVLTFKSIFKNVPPISIKEPYIKDGKLKYEVLDPNYEDLSIPESNIGITRIDTYYRCPTQITCYASGFNNIIEDYDIAILEANAQSISSIQRFTDLGIITLGYISFGEEDSTNTTPWEEYQELGPFTGDGNGPGGYASYYMKGGDKSQELHQCDLDNKINGSNSCQLSRSEYNDSFCCSKGCSEDYHGSWNSYISNGSCNKGHTIDNNWIKDSASSACVNTDCPDYVGMNSNCPKYIHNGDGWLDDYSSTIKTPDENGVWKSYFTNSNLNETTAWLSRIEDYYIPIMLGIPEVKTIQLNIAKHDTSNGSILGVIIPDAPFDIDSGFNCTLIKADGTETPLINNVDNSFDTVTGVIKVLLSDAAENDTLRITYTTKRLNMSGIFMDTVDTIDVYPSDDFLSGMVSMIRYFTEKYKRLWCSNRGFSILDRTSKYVNFYMFESFLTDYNWTTKKYSKVDNISDTYNIEVMKNLAKNRDNNNFEVIALNYCDNGHSGDILRDYIARESRKLGYISWSTTILLNDPLKNIPIITEDLKIKTNIWEKIRGLKI